MGDIELNARKTHLMYRETEVNKAIREHSVQTMYKVKKISSKNCIGIFLLDLELTKQANRRHDIAKQSYLQKCRVEMPV